MILQVVVTIAVVLGLIVALYWVARRYSAGALGRLGRGRVPRLAVVDAAAVDGRRQLVLVRRDNVEHLILIGGPSDVVVEQGIQRRRRQPGEQPNGATPEAAPTSQPENPPIPFPQPARAATPAPTTASASPFQTSRRSAAAAQSLFAAPRSDGLDVTRVERSAESGTDSVGATLAFPAPGEPAPTRESFVLAEPSPAPQQTPFAPPPRAFEESLSASGSAPSATSPSPSGFDLASSATAAALPSDSDDTAAKVNDLEREMARLLGEITAGKRP